MKRTVATLCFVLFACSLASAQDSTSGQLDSKSLPDTKGERGITPNGYVYQQDFLPHEEMKLDLSRTAVFITDPQNDFLSEGGAANKLVKADLDKHNVIQHQVQLCKTAKELGMKVFYSPHMYTEKDYRDWPRRKMNAIDKAMFSLNMYKKDTWGWKFHPDLKPDENTIVMNPHKGLTNFWTGDAVIQLRMHEIDTLIMAGMACNLCTESHCRDATENGFEVIIVADAVAGPGPLSHKAAIVNYEFIAHEVVTTDQIVKRMKGAKSMEKGKEKAAAK